LLAPHLAGFIDRCNGTITNPMAVRDSLHELMESALNEDLRALEVSMEPAVRKGPKRDMLRQRQALWRSHRRRATGMSLCDGAGYPIIDTPGISEHLVAHWGPTFAAKAVDPEAMVIFLDHVQSVPAGFSWEISPGMLDNAIDVTGSSAPGPDGVPYGAWRSANKACREVLFRILDATLTRNTELPVHFNHSHLIFIPKNTEVSDEMVIGHSAGDLRPLNLSNSDNKLFSLALNGRLAALCQISVAPPQRGFVAGRHLEDNLLGLEAAAISLSATNLKRSAAIFFDFRTAFPSLAHTWIFAVLTRMGIPSYFIHAVRQLYTDCSAMLLFNGAELDSILIESGIKQGCPLSGSLFALAIDPLIRYLLHTSVLGSLCLTAFADDIAIVVANLFTMLPGILESFSKWALATSLCLNYVKSAIIPLWIFDSAMIWRWLRVVAPAFAACSISSAAKYLGIIVGPAADSLQWAPVEHKVLSRAAEASFCGSGLIDKVIHFKIHGTSTVVYKAQFADPSSSMLSAYRKAEQRLTAAPWMALAPDILHALVPLGLPAGLVDIQMLATAAKLRLVASSATFWEAVNTIDSALASDDALMVMPLFGWYSTGIIGTLRRTWHAHHLLDGVSSILRKPDATHLQRDIYRALMKPTGAQKAWAVLRRRVAYWQFSEADARLVFSTLCTVLASRLPSPLRLAVLRSVCNAWNTSSRYHQPVGACIFGCDSPADDRMVHYLCCPALAVQSFRLLSLDASTLAAKPLLSLVTLLASPAQRSVAALYFDAALFAFNAKKNGAAASAGHVFAARIRDMRRRTPSRLLP
jgi:hypothetical protein